MADDSLALNRNWTTCDRGLSVSLDARKSNIQYSNDLNSKHDSLPDPASVAPSVSRRGDLCSSDVKFLEETQNEAEGESKWENTILVR